VARKQWDRANSDAAECSPKTAGGVNVRVDPERKQSGGMYHGPSSGTIDLVENCVSVTMHDVKRILWRSSAAVSGDILIGGIESILRVKHKMYCRPVRMLQGK